MGSDYQTSGANSEPTYTTLSAYNAWLPSLLQSVYGQESSGATAALGASNRMDNPNSNEVLGQNALNLQQLQRYALPEAVVGQQVARSNALAGAETNKEQITGSGGETARAGSALMNELSPAYAKTGDALKNFSLTGLSPGEASAVERSTNQTNTGTGNLGLNNPTNVVSNAMNFGGAFNSKYNTLNNLSNANTTASNGFNPVSTALGQPSSSTGTNFGTGQFTNTTGNSANASNSNAFNFGSGLLSNLTSISNTQQTTGASMANATSPASYLGAICCFIFLEAFYGKIPKCVRKGRDKYYYINPFIASGYRRMASWLVPLMRENSFIRSAVWVMIVNPITKHLSNPKKGMNKQITHFWLRLWAILGNNKCEADYCHLTEYSYV